jgi:hypothetical protein
VEDLIIFAALAVIGAGLYSLDAYQGDRKFKAVA